MYVTYIATTAEKVFKALIEGETARRYWFGLEARSDWRQGSVWELSDSARTAVIGKVIEIRPPHRLVLTWAEPADAHDPAQHARVAFDIETLKEAVRLTVTHDQFAVGSTMPGRITDGWPRVLSNLKSLLETGRVFDLGNCGSAH